MRFSDKKRNIQENIDIPAGFPPASAEKLRCGKPTIQQKDNLYSYLKYALSVIDKIAARWYNYMMR